MAPSLQQQIAEQNKRIAKQQQKMLNQQQQINQQHQQMMNQILSQLRPLEDRFNNGGGLEMIPRNNLQFNPKVEFPSFDGKDLKGWIKKCTRYFGFAGSMRTRRLI